VFQHHERFDGKGTRWPVEEHFPARGFSWRMSSAPLSRIVHTAPAGAWKRSAYAGKRRPAIRPEVVEAFFRRGAEADATASEFTGRLLETTIRA
jgi:hypothetical protein